MTRLVSTSGLFLSTGRGLASFTPNSIPSNVLATLRSWISGLSGVAVSSVYCLSKQLPPGNLSSHHPRARYFYHLDGGLSWILPSLMWRATMPLGDSLSVSSVSSRHFANDQNTFTKRMKLNEFIVGYVTYCVGCCIVCRYNCFISRELVYIYCVALHIHSRHTNVSAPSKLNTQ